jgi:hypothetical protein
MGMFRAVLPVAVLAALAVAPNPASSAETCWTEGSGQFYDAIHYCVSSELKSGSRWHYGPDNLVGDEGGQHLAWCEGVRGPGIGEAITLRIDNGASFRRLIIANGYGKSEKSYFENARVRIFHVTTDTGLSTSFRLPDQPQPVLLPLPDVGEFRWVRLEIGDIYAGSRYEDTCLDFLGPDFEYEDELAAQQATPSPVPPVATPPIETKPDIPPPPAVTQPPAITPPPQAPVPLPSVGADDPFGDLGMPDADQLRLPGQ